jgi:hypothetical protein
MGIKKIGFIGTGIMGAAMAGHLLAAGFEVSVYNRTKAKAEGLLSQGAKWCDSPGACAKGQDAVITIVGYPKDVEEVYLGENGIIENAREGAYLIDMTTSSPILAERIFAAAKEKGLHAVDAPADTANLQNAVTRYDQRQRIRAHRVTNRAGGAGLARKPRQLTVGDCFAVGYKSGGVPDRKLKLRSQKGKRQVKCLPFTV